MGVLVWGWRLRMGLLLSIMVLLMFKASPIKVRVLRFGYRLRNDG
jgi:hypothetical protein